MRENKSRNLCKYVENHGLSIILSFKVRIFSVYLINLIIMYSNNYRYDVFFIF